MPLLRPGEVRLRMPEVTVRLSLLLAVAVVALTWLYAVNVEWRPVVTFAGVASGVAGGLLSAYYVGRSLKTTIEQREHALIQQQVERAFEFVRRRNDPNFGALRG